MRLYSRKEAAELLGIGLTTLDQRPHFTAEGLLHKRLGHDTLQRQIEIPPHLRDHFVVQLPNFPLTKGFDLRDLIGSLGPLLLQLLENRNRFLFLGQGRTLRLRHLLDLLRLVQLLQQPFPTGTEDLYDGFPENKQDDAGQKQKIDNNIS